MFLCSSCNKISQKWSGRCLLCQAWGTLEARPDMEENVHGRRSKTMTFENTPKPFLLSSVESTANQKHKTGFGELDAILGGGLAMGSLLLLGGEPGIGKSTIALQLADSMVKTRDPRLRGDDVYKILYVSGEENPHQIKNRAERLGVDTNRIQILATTCIEEILEVAKMEKPIMVILDSIQTLYSLDIPSEIGSPNQIRGVAQKILDTLKPLGISALILGQITKEGNLAGPKMLEHLVDAVLYLEGEKDSAIRILRVPKNRFGTTSEILLFKMDEKGLRPISNINEEAISNLETQAISGSAFTFISDSGKNFLLEVQSLVTKTLFGYPQRKAIGIDPNRLQILSAVMSKYTRTQLQGADIHLSTAGAIKSYDTASDLAIAAAILSSAHNIPLDRKTLFIGEIGLGGELKNTRNLQSKLKEAEKLGFNQAWIPETGKHTLSDKSQLKIYPIRTIAELEAHHFKNNKIQRAVENGLD